MLNHPSTRNLVLTLQLMCFYVFSQIASCLLGLLGPHSNSTGIRFPFVTVFSIRWSRNGGAAPSALPPTAGAHGLIWQLPDVLRRDLRAVHELDLPGRAGSQPGSPGGWAFWGRYFWGEEDIFWRQTSLDELLEDHRSSF